MTKNALSRRKHIRKKSKSSIGTILRDLEMQVLATLLISIADLA
jgi:hypothetical protein